jgi:hypothetical protein
MMHTRRQRFVAGVTIATALSWYLMLSPSYGQGEGDVLHVVPPAGEEEPSERDRKPRKEKGNKPGQSLGREQLLFRVTVKVPNRSGSRNPIGIEGTPGKRG